MNLNEKDLPKWFHGKDWLENPTISPHPACDVIKFSSFYFADPGLWEKAFGFLKSANLSAMSAGIYKIQGEDLFANVQEYVTRDEKETRYEAHRQYADIQYLITGSERIGVIPLEKTSEVIPYDEANDIVFLKGEFDAFHVATQAHFFIFLPGDAHRPCVMYEKCEPVKKVVLKVRL